MSIAQHCYMIQSMGTKVHLYSNLRSYAGGQSIMDVSGDTVGACLQDLVRQYPQLQPKLFDNSGTLSSQIYLSINMQSPYTEKPDKVLKPGEELYVVLIVAGG